jgi:MFS family permease
MTLQAPFSPEQTHQKARIISVIAGTLIALACGTNYGFSAWAPSFADRLGLSATEINILGNAGNLGMYATGIPAGLLIDSRGPRWGVLLGCICLACGYFPLHKAYEASGEGYSVALLCFCCFLTGVGSCSAFSASIKTCATNWPRHRGTATAFPLSGFGLSAFLFTFVGGIAFPDDTAGLLLLLAAGTFCMVFVGMLFLRIIPATSPYEAVPEEERPGYKRNDSNPLRRSRSQHARHNSNNSAKADNGKTMECTACLCSANTNSENADETSSLVSSPTSSCPGDIADRKPHHSHAAHHPDITGFALVKTPKFWQLFVMLGLLCGVGLMSINNIGNVAKALWYHYDDSVSRDFVQKRQLMHVGIISFCSFLGRLISGIGSDWLIHHHASRFWTLVGSGCIFTAAQTVGLTLQDPNELFLLSGLTGLAYGALFGVYPALVADAFGPSGMGINWGAMTMAPVISGNVFNLVYGSILDKHSYSSGGDGGEGGSPGEMICGDGRDCYASAYYLTLISSVVGVAWSLYCIRHEKVARLRDAKAAERPHEG